jgi:ADP-ribose pyrophosphatase
LLTTFTVEPTIEMTNQRSAGGSDAYQDLIVSHPQWFVSDHAGIRIETVPGSIRQIEEIIGARYASRGQPEEWARVGILYEDPYIVLLRDAVTFPDGSPGIHHRVLRRSGEPAGVAMMPILDGKLVLVRHYRHPTRSWHWEFPRGAIEPGQTPMAAARCELLEEISAVVQSIEPIGIIHGASALMGMSVVMFAAYVTSIGRTALQDGIAATEIVSVRAFETMVKDGEVTDSFTLGCFLNARLRGLL